jgi:hypothetical protein
VRDTRGVRATGLQGEESSEIIEIIDDDTDAFGDRAPNITIHDTGGPRWVGPVAALALVALIGYGVATSASSGAPKASPAPSTTTPRPTTTPPPAPTTTVPAPLVPYYSADPPREFSVSSAEINEPNGFVDSVKYQLWATEGSTASSGSWFSIESFSGRGFAIDAYRVETGERSIGLSHTSSGQAIAQFLAGPYSSVTITSFGISDADLIRLAASVTVSGGSVTLTDPSLISDFTLISSVNPWLAVQGIPVESVFYQSNRDFNGGIHLAVAPRLRPDQGGSTLDRQIALRFFLDNTTVFDVDGHVAVAGSLVSQYEFAVASWIAGDHVVTLSSSLTVPELVAIARTVHQVPLDEWQGMQFQATKYNADNNFGGFDKTQPAAVSFGTDAQSNPWVVKVSMLTFPNQRVVSWAWDTNGPTGIPSAADDTAKLSTVVENQRTYVLADLPRAVATTAQLQINRDGFDPVVVPFNDVSPDFDRTFAAYAFSEPTTYTAQIIGEDGTVLASWPRP